LKAHQRSPTSLVIGTRASALALAQAYLVQATLASFFPDFASDFSIAPMTTAGDKNQTQALYLMGGKALWTQELEVALMEEAIDMIVHCAKDVPTALPAGCELGAILKREDPRDCVVVKKGLEHIKSLQDLPDGSVVGTSSVRRVAQLRRAYPKLLFADVRGNIATRLSKLDEPEGPFSALILASAGLIRLNLSSRITASLDAPTVLYAVGQGALAIETRANDDRVRKMVAKLNEWQTSWRVLAEREMLRVLEGGCSVPVGVVTSLRPIQQQEDEDEPTPSIIKMEGCIVSLSGKTAVRSSYEREISSAEEAEALGQDVAQDLIRKGGKEILEELGRTVKAVDFKDRHTLAVKNAMDRAHEVLKSPEMRAKGLPVQESHCGQPELQEKLQQVTDDLSL